MNKLHALAITACLSMITSAVSAQQCENGICRINGRSAAPPSTGLQFPLGFRNANVPAWQSPKTGFGVCSNGNCSCTPGCANGTCNGQYCSCGPNGQTQHQGGGISGYRDAASLNSRQTQPEWTPRQSTIQAPPLRSRGFQPVALPTNISWESDFRRASQLAQQTGRPLLIKVSADWCGYCQQMKAETFADSRIVRDISSGFIPVSLNADTNRELIQQLRVQSLPTVLVMSPTMTILAREEGFRSAAQLAPLLNRYMQRAQLQTETRVAAR